MNKVVDIKTAIDKIKSGDKVAVGGFTNYGAPMNLLYELANHPEINHLATISEDFHYGGLPWKQGFMGMLENNQIDEIIVSFLSLIHIWWMLAKLSLRLSRRELLRKDSALRAQASADSILRQA